MSFSQFFNADTETSNNLISIIEIEEKLFHTTSDEELTLFMTQMFQSDDSAQKLYQVLTAMESTLRAESRQYSETITKKLFKLNDISKALEDPVLWDKKLNRYYCYPATESLADYQSLEAELHNIYGKDNIEEGRDINAYLNQAQKQRLRNIAHYEKLIRIYEKTLAEHGQKTDSLCRLL